MDHEKEAKKKNSPGKIIGNLFTTVILIAVAALLILFVGVRVVGITPYVVQTASMEPAYPVGSIIYVKHVDGAEVKVGDPITYMINTEGLLATHRVVQIDADRQLYYTKGDAAETTDATPVPWSALIGIPKFSIPKIGYLAQYVGSKQGRVIAITAVAILLVLAVFPQLLSSAEKSDKKKAAQKAAGEGGAGPTGQGNEPPSETEPPK